MDVTIMTIESTAPAREVLRDQRGTIIGAVEPQRLTGKLIARDARGVVLGSYDPRLIETRDAQGRVIGRGDLLGALLMQAR